MKTNVNWLWNKLKTLPSYLKVSLSLPIIATMMVGSFKIAKVDEDAYKLFNGIVYRLYDFLNPKPTVSVDSIKTDSTKIVIIKPDSIHTNKDSLSPQITIETRDHRDKPKPKPPKLLPIDNIETIDYEHDVAIINILYAISIDDAAVSHFKQKLNNMVKNRAQVSDPVQSSQVVENLNSIKLPIESDKKRIMVARKIAKTLDIRFNVISKNDASSTIIKIGKL
jgi:hypothetical protein